MWYANESDSRKRNGGAWAPVGSLRDRGASGGAGVTKSLHENPPTPGSRSGGVRSFAPATEDFGGEGVFVSPRRGSGDRPEVTRAPLAPATATSPPTQGAPPPALSSLCPLLTSTTRGEISQPKAHRPANSCTPRQVHPSSVPACVLSPGSLATPAGHPRPTPRPNLLVRVCFFGHFPVHLDACPAAGSFAPFIFLSAHPPSSHLRRSPDLVGEGERREMKGRRRREKGKQGDRSAGEVWGRGAKASCGRSERSSARGSAGGAPGARQRAEGGEIWAGDGGGGEEEKNKRAVERLRLLRGGGEKGQPRVGAQSGVAPGGRANQGSRERSAAGGGAPGRRCRAPRPSPISRLHRFTPYWILTAANRRRK